MPEGATWSHSWSCWDGSCVWRTWRAILVGISPCVKRREGRRRIAFGVSFKDVVPREASPGDHLHHGGGLRPLGGKSEQGHLDIYYYIENRSYGVFGARATTFLVLDGRSAGKLISRGPTTKEIAPPQRPHNTMTTTIRVVVCVREPNFP